MLGIDTGPLPSSVANAVEDVLRDLLATHPGLTAFQLGGSYWDVSSQLPAADVDLRRFGEIRQDAEDPRVAAPITRFHHGGVLIELAEWIYGDLNEPASLSLRDAVSLARSHILWERGSRVRQLVEAARLQVADRDWRDRKLDEELASCQSRFSGLLAANRCMSSLFMPPAATTDDHYFKHVFYTLVDYFSGLLSAIDLRPPSLARKAMMEIADCLVAADLPELVDPMYEALGCGDFDLAECLQWRDEVAAVYAMTEGAGLTVSKREYHMAGIAAMLERGHWRAAVFPVWRSLDECRMTSEGQTAGALRNRIARDLERLRFRLRFSDEASITERIVRCQDVLRMLVAQRERLRSHLDDRVAQWVAPV
jgi:hypothetical protein